MSKFYGQAWISGDSLVQEVISFNEGGSRDAMTTTEVIVENIWNSLLDEVGIEPVDDTAGIDQPYDPINAKYYVKYQDQAKTKPYFYWKVKQTPVEEGASTIWIAYMCPEPKPGLFIPPYDLLNEYQQYKDDQDSNINAHFPYPNYWIKKLKAASDNYQNSAIIQRGTVVFDGMEYVGPKLSDDADPNPDTATTNDPNIYADPHAKVDPYTYENNDLGDITNLLRLF